MAGTKIAHKPMLHGQGLDARKVRASEGFMLYRISEADNNSKFYEGLMLPNDDGTYRVFLRYGALTDSGFTGRIMGAQMDAKLSHLDERKAKSILPRQEVPGQDKSGEPGRPVRGRLEAQSAQGPVPDRPDPRRELRVGHTRNRLLHPLPADYSKSPGPGPVLDPTGRV